MCGIVGYIGDKEAAEILIEGLKKLEYRGYDSAGIAIRTESGKTETVKAQGKIKNLEDKLSSIGTPKGFSGIGHTRWATHGAPSDINSHPHSSGRVTLVHNGIIENYSALKASLAERGRAFISDTDTEVLACLIDHYYVNDPFDAIFKAVSRVKGSYALAVMFADDKDKIYAIRKDSPLVIGLGKGENYIASDIPAILSNTREYYLIDEQELAVVEKNSVTIYNSDREKLKKDIMTAQWDIEAAEKGGYPHFMLKEIYEQPKALKDTTAFRIDGGIHEILKEELPDTSFIERLHIVGCGSAMHVGLVAKYAIEGLAKVPVSVDIASEFRYRDPILSKGDVVIIISQSGETADSKAALLLAKSKGAKVISIVNVVGSSIARESDIVLYTKAGPEIAVATTKAFTSQLALLYVLALRLAVDRHTISDEKAEEIRKAILKLPDDIKLIYDDIDYYQHLASYTQNADDIFFIGRGLDAAICNEGSLKLKEISYIHSEAYAAGELKHGTISLITEGVPVVAVATQQELIEKTVSNVKETKSRGANVILVCKKGTKFEDKFYDHLIEIPATCDLLMPILTIIPLQIFAYYTSVGKGYDADKPRNLAKSVTVE